jgi:peptidoglycan-N-acetylglucosamine deacetylase
MTTEEDSMRPFTSFFLGISVFAMLLSSCNDEASTTVKTNTDTTIVKKDSATEATASALEDSSKKKIYLTFDDGPNPGTANVLNILEKEQVPATFFLIGEHRYYGPEEQRDWDRLRADNQIVLCNHSYTHAWRNRFDRFYAHPDRVIADFARCQDSLKFNNPISRTPGRNTWRLNTISRTDMRKSKAAVDSLAGAGFVMMGWDLEWQYYGRTQTLKTDADSMLHLIDQLFKSNETRTPNHLVLLAHDRVYADSVDAAQLSYFIKELKKHPEYELRVATSYPGVDKPFIVQ